MSSKLKIDTRVRSLKNYLEEFEQGAFQIPSFQRDFLWNQDAIIQLFDSIKNNYPIGSILFWKPLENSISYIDDQEPRIGPYKYNLKEKKEPVFILDGLQRLTSLFGCLINPNKTKLELVKSIWDDKFNVHYDLEEEKFIYLRQKSKNLPFQVPVFIFMNSIDFRQYARKEFEKINDETRIEQYYDRADEIGQIFNNYQIASVDIEYASIDEAVEIFKRVNEKGLPIAKDWIVSALTNKGDFRLGTEIDNLLDELKQFDFNNLKRDVIFQCIQNSFGRVYFDFKIEDLVKRKDFIEITIKTILSIKKAVKFLYEDLLVLNNKLIPYNSQLIFLTTFFNHLGENKATKNQILSLKKWFWITSYSNYFTIYSLSNQRKAFDKFNEFIMDENINPIFNDNDSPFTSFEFPPKIYMGSVRAKTLALFMINHSCGIKSINLEKVNFEDVEQFEITNLFSKPQKDNPSENFIPVINYVVEKNNLRLFKSLSKIKKPKNYSFLLSEENEKFFITREMVKLYDGSINSENQILKIRWEEIIKSERRFVESLGIYYNEPINF
ncbi:DUF262 domain-containing protein [Flavobacterium pectinovorum]|uniref:DUF262 domain-containing protein n=1 Tax=Flavobacterium pectinovorum TaxID=29533 RepID=UPI00265D7231|nr:DUF262 domain-containing protein [Flavobacterium pectinovorum]WKL48253.1 DUF262 domain-containing protein [Flavobacterium pectinovorum]